jgi:hypothetical protein
MGSSGERRLAVLESTAAAVAAAVRIRTGFGFA